MYAASSTSYGNIDANNAGHYGQIISKASAAATVTYTPTLSACASGTYQVYSTSSGYCVALNQAAVGTYSPTYADLPSTSYKYAAFNLSVPAVSGTTYFYTLNVSLPSNFTDVKVSVTGSSWNRLDTQVGASMQLGTGTEQFSGSIIASQRTFQAKFLVPQSSVQVVVKIWQLATGATVPVTFAFQPETDQQLVFAPTTISTANNAIVTPAAVVTPAASMYYKVAQRFTASGSNGYDITVSADANMQAVQVVNADFSTVVASVGLTGSVNTKYNFNVPSTYMPAGDYHILVQPYTSGQKTYTFTVGRTIGSTASGIYPSIAVMIIALLALFC